MKSNACSFCERREGIATSRNGKVRVCGPCSAGDARAMVTEAAAMNGGPAPMDVPEGVAGGQLSLAAKAAAIRTRASRQRRGLFGAELSLSLLDTQQKQLQADAARRAARPRGAASTPAARAKAVVQKLGMGASGRPAKS